MGTAKPQPTGSANAIVRSVLSLAATLAACSWFFQESINEYWLVTRHTESPLARLSGVGAWETGARAKSWADGAAQTAYSKAQSLFDAVNLAYNRLAAPEALAALGQDGEGPNGLKTQGEATGLPLPAGAPIADSPDALGQTQDEVEGEVEGEVGRPGAGESAAAWDSGDPAENPSDDGADSALGRPASALSGFAAREAGALGEAQAGQGVWAMFGIPPDMPLAMDEDAYWAELERQNVVLPDAPRPKAQPRAGRPAAQEGQGIPGGPSDGADRPARAQAKRDGWIGEVDDPESATRVIRGGHSVGQGEIKLAPGEQIAFIGDSMMEAAGSNAQKILAKEWKVRAVNLGRHSTGLTRPSYYDWPDAARRYLDSHPQIRHVFVFMGANDPWKMSDPETGKPIDFGSAKWNAIYFARVKAMALHARRRGLSLVWLQTPNMRSNRLNAGAHLLNALYATAMKQTGGIYALTNDALGMAGSEAFTAIDKKGPGGAERLLRSKDGVHFTQAGLDELAGLIVSYLSIKPAEDAPDAARRMAESAPRLSAGLGAEPGAGAPIPVPIVYDLPEFGKTDGAGRAPGGSGETADSPPDKAARSGADRFAKAQSAVPAPGAGAGAKSASEPAAAEGFGEDAAKRPPAANPTKSGRPRRATEPRLEPGAKASEPKKETAAPTLERALSGAENAALAGAPAAATASESPNKQPSPKRKAAHPARTGPEFGAAGGPSRGADFAPRAPVAPPNGYGRAPSGPRGASSGQPGWGAGAANPYRVDPAQPWGAPANPPSGPNLAPAPAPLPETRGDAPQPQSPNRGQRGRAPYGQPRPNAAPNGFGPNAGGYPAPNRAPAIPAPRGPEATFNPAYGAQPNGAPFRARRPGAAPRPGAFARPEDRRPRPDDFAHPPAPGDAAPAQGNRAPEPGRFAPPPPQRPNGGDGANRRPDFAPSNRPPASPTPYPAPLPAHYPAPYPAPTAPIPPQPWPNAPRSP